jgi:lipoprotein-releasing system ATP-binding protein
MNSGTGAVLSCQGLAKSYRQGTSKLEVLTDVNLRVQPGESVAVLGTSGAGKSTLLHLLGGLDRPDMGDVQVNGDSIWNLSAKARGELRNRSFGFVYQFHHLLPEFTALENVAMPLLIRKLAPNEAKKQATDILARVGLAARLSHKPGELSGGERQRAAVARALVGRPDCVLGDEPTGNLDEDNANQVYDMMLELNQELKTALVLVTHDPRLAARMDRRLQLSHGKLNPMD